jgi:hypothetical protein
MDVAGINAQYDILQQAVVKEEADVTAFIAAAKAAGGASPADLDALAAKFAETTKMVSDFDINTTAPPTPPAKLGTPQGKK